MGFGLRLRRGASCTLKAILVCHLHRVAPTLATILEIAALAGHLIPAATAGSGAGSGSGALSGSASDDGAGAPPAPRRGARRRERPVWAVAAARGAMRAAHGFAPAVVMAQAVRLAANLVREAEQRRMADTSADDKGATEVRALQLGLSSVPRVDPRVPRALDDYCAIYREWLLLLRGRLQQQSLELPPEVFDEGNHELMRYALCYSVLQARSLKEALIAMDKTLANVRDFVAWWPKYQFLGASDLEAWSRITWWEGPDDEGRLWLMIDNHAAINASRTHGADVVARVVISNVEHGVRALMGECGARDTINVVVDNTGVPQAALLRHRAAFQRVAGLLERCYPSRLASLYVVGLPAPSRLAMRASIQFLQLSTRRKVKAARARDVPCKAVPSALRSHKLSQAAGLESLGYAGDGSAAALQHAAGAAGGGPSGGGAAQGEGAADAWSDVAPVTPGGRTPRALRRGPGSRSGGGGGASRPARAAGVAAVMAVAAAGLAFYERAAVLPLLGLGGGGGALGGGVEEEAGGGGINASA